MNRSEPLSFEAFQAMLADLLHVDKARITPEASFVADLGVDSLRMLGLLLKLEKLGIEFRLEAAPHIQTVGEAYAYYRRELPGLDLEEG